MNSETTTTPDPAAAAPGAEPRASIWEDFLDIFYAPAAVFARRREGPFWPALLVLTVLMILLFYAGQQALAPMFDAEFERATEAALRQNPELTAEQLERMREMGETFGLIGFAVGFPVGVLVIGLVVWVAGKLFGAAAGLVTALTIAVYSQFPRIVQQLAALGQGLVMSPESLDSRYAVSVGPARFLDPDTTAPVLLTLASRFDVFTLWATALVGVGLYVAGRLPKGQAAAAALLVWLVGALPELLGALRAG